MRSMNSGMARSAVKEKAIQLVGFTLGPKRFGADIREIREILRHPLVEPLDNSPDFIAGIVRVRGSGIPIIDLAGHLRSESSGNDYTRKWVLVTLVQERPVGFLVDAVTRILKIDSDMILPAPELILAGLRSQYIRGVCDTEKGLLMVLEFDRLLVDDEIKSIRRLTFK